MLNLSHSLQTRANLIGADCENIGKTVGKGLFAKKVMISYDRDKGWECVELNPLQLFLRNAFGLYKSTHLETIAKGLNRALDSNRVSYPATSQTPALVSKFDQTIKNLWANSHNNPFPKLPANSSKNIEIYALKAHLTKQFNKMDSLINKKGEISDIDAFTNHVLITIDALKELGHHTDYDKDKIYELQVDGLKYLEEAKDTHKGVLCKYYLVAAHSHIAKQGAKKAEQEMQDAEKTKTKEPDAEK